LRKLPLQRYDADAKIDATQCKLYSKSGWCWSNLRKPRCANGAGMLTCDNVSQLHMQGRKWPTICGKHVGMRAAETIFILPEMACDLHSC
jgi:hypothetical protein